MKKLLLALGTALGLALASTSASATSLSYPGALRDALPSSNIETVHWRGYVHCHVGRYGNRFAMADLLAVTWFLGVTWLLAFT